MIRWLFFLVMIASPVLPVKAQDIAMLIREADRLEAVPDEKAAFQKFREVLKLQPLNMYALYKCSELCSRIGKRQVYPKVRDDYYHAAKTYAAIALKINPADSDANCAMAMALGRSSLSKSGKEKVANAKEVKKYVDASLRSNPNNYLALHILGRWHYEINNLSMLERAAVKVLYGGMPAASIRESIAAFEKVRSLQPGFILNYLEMAKSYKQDGQKAKAITYLKWMLSLPNHTEDDPAIKEMGRSMINDWE